MVQFFDYLGVAVFAATGALAASRNNLDLIAFMFFAAVTGVGGGTLRDLLIGEPIFWIDNSRYIIICFVVAILVWFTAHLAESRYRLLLWADAFGLAGYSVMGAAKALEADTSLLAAILMGAMTATFGGLIRDVIAGTPSVLLRREIYISAAFAGAAGFVALQMVDIPAPLAAFLGFALALTIRAGALAFGWSFPAYRLPSQPQ
ncbi:MAG: trimeric intracellular cation channel family protein [Stappiaceae bacterium]